MKKLLFSLIAVISLGFNANAKETVSSFESEFKTENPLKINIHIEFGRQSKGCEGWGICSFDIDIELDIDDINFKGSADKNGRLTLEMSNAALDTIVKKFGSNTIIIEENFKLSDKACKSLGLRTGYTIKTGKYNVVKDQTGNYVVTL